jgi:hypothetical protein
MTNAQAILIGSALVTAAIFLSNGGSPVSAQSGSPVIPPVEALVPANDASGVNGPWHIWRVNRHTGQLSFCTADKPTQQSAQGSQEPLPVVECTKTSPAM